MSLQSNKDQAWAESVRFVINMQKFSWVLKYDREFGNVEAEIYGGVPDVPLKITCSLNVDASFWLQMFSAKLMLRRISMQVLMIGNASKNSMYHWILLLNFAHNLLCSIWCLVVFFWFSTECSRNLHLWKFDGWPKLQSNETKLDLKKQFGRRSH